jgi:hypothetical protein
MSDTIMDGRSQQQWQSLLDSASDGIWGVDDAEGMCTFANRVAAPGWLASTAIS